MCVRYITAHDNGFLHAIAGGMTTCCEEPGQLEEDCSGNLSAMEVHRQGRLRPGGHYFAVGIHLCTLLLAGCS